MGHVAGYTVADYLYQHARRTRRATPLPNAAWDALVEHHHDDDTTRLAENAEARCQDRHATHFYRQLADSGSWQAAKRLVELLIDQGRIGEAIEVLRPLADAGDDHAAYQLADLLFGLGRTGELQALADTGDDEAAQLLAWLLVDRGCIDELWARANTGATGFGYAAEGLADLLVDQGRTDEVIELLRAPAEAGYVNAAIQLASQLVNQGRPDEAIELLQTRADDRRAGHAIVATGLAKLLIDQGRIGELQVRAEAGDEYAVKQLTDLLVGQGRIDEAIEVLRNHAKTSRWFDSERLVERLVKLLVDQRHPGEAIEVLRARVGEGDKDAARRLVELLAVPPSPGREDTRFTPAGSPDGRADARCRGRPRLQGDGAHGTGETLLVVADTGEVRQGWKSPAVPPASAASRSWPRCRRGTQRRAGHLRAAIRPDGSDHRSPGQVVVRIQHDRRHATTDRTTRRSRLLPVPIVVLT
jgi:thioredoxin-like negative regulator of GroEL